MNLSDKRLMPPTLIFLTCWNLVACVCYSRLFADFHCGTTPFDVKSLLSSLLILASKKQVFEPIFFTFEIWKKEVINCEIRQFLLTHRNEKKHIFILMQKRRKLKLNS